MIARLRGVLLEVEDGRLTLEVAGVGYEVSVPSSVALALPALGEEVALHTRQVFREDGVTLFGFLDPADRTLFDLLTDVKGCGPKIALSVLATLGTSTTVSAILQQDARTLARSPGVGPRLAERIGLELREKVTRVPVSVSAPTVQRTTPTRVDHELVDALLALGYRRLEAETAARDAAGASLEDQLKDALKRLAK